MYFWNVSALAHDLKENKVTEYEKMKYFLMHSILLGLTVLVIEISPARDLISSLISFLIVILLVIVGVFLCYRTNAKGDNKYFLSRFICLGFPIFIKISLLFFVVSFLFDIFSCLFGFVNPILYIKYYLHQASGYILIIIHYLWIYNKISYISGSVKKP